MQNVSEEFKTSIVSTSPEFESRITFPDLILDNSQITSIEMNSTLGGDDFEIGTAPMDMVKVELVEDTGDEWGRNLSPNSENLMGHWSGYRGASITYSEVDVTDEWGFSEGYRLQISGGTNIIKGVFFYSGMAFNQNYTYSLYIKNMSDKPVIMNMNGLLGAGNSALPVGYSGRFIATGQRRELSDWFQCNLRTRNVEDEVDVIVGREKIEKGSVATPWTPAPEDYANYDYKNKECDIELGLTLPDESVEYVSIGKFTVENAVRKNNVITLDCVDRMYKAEKDYVSDLMYPTTLGQILQSACDQAGIELATTTFANSDYIVPNEPVYEGVTCRKVFAQVAELAGGYAKINSLGQLEIITLGNESVRDITKDHYFDLKINEVAEASIDKVIVKVGEEAATKGDGENIYTVVDNMFVQNPANVVDALYSVLKNVSYTACTLKWQGDFSLDLGDKVTVDGYETYILSRKLSYTGGLREDYTAPAKSNIEKKSTGKGSLTLDIENVKTQIKVIDGEIKQTIERVENLVVGANNRLYDSQTEIPFGFNSGVGIVQLFRDQIHPYYKAVSDQDINLFAAFPDSQFAEPLAELGEITISLDVMVDVDREVTIDGKGFNIKANRWTRVHVVKEFTENTTKRLRVRNPFSRKRTRDIDVGTKLIEQIYTDINTLYYRNLKVERGNVATDWTLTPEELEVDVDRMGSEIKQLADSISLIARRNENTGRFEVTPEAIVAAIDTTDGVGRVKNVGVTIDEYGLTVENGALIVRDARNAAIITSDGLKAIYNFTSSGEYNGWQLVGILGIGGPDEVSYQAGISVFIPENFIVEKATLYTRSASSYLTGYQTTEGVSDGYYHGKNLGLYIMSGDDMVFDYRMDSSYGVWYGSAGTNITTPVWGGRWSPIGEGVKVKTGDVKDYLTPGEQTLFVVESSDSPSNSTKADFSLMKFDLVIEGFLRG